MACEKARGSPGTEKRNECRGLEDGQQPRWLHESTWEDVGFDSERRAAMEDFEQERDIVRRTVLIDRSGHWRGDSEDRGGWWPRREMTGLSWASGGAHVHSS